MHHRVAPSSSIHDSNVQTRPNPTTQRGARRMIRCASPAASSPDASHASAPRRPRSCVARTMRSGGCMVAANAAPTGRGPHVGSRLRNTRGCGQKGQCATRRPRDRAASSSAVRAAAAGAPLAQHSQHRIAAPAQWRDARAVARRHPPRLSARELCRTRSKASRRTPRRPFFHAPRHHHQQRSGNHRGHPRGARDSHVAISCDRRYR